MATNREKSKREDQVHATLAFATYLEKTLEGPDFPVVLSTQLIQEIEKLKLLHNLASADKSSELDSVGTRLWNLGSKLKKGNIADAELLCAVLVFACLLIDSAGHCLQISKSNEIRIFRTALRTTKYCLEHRQLSLAEMIVERAAFYDERLRETLHNGKSVVESLWIEYMIIRIALSWRQGRLDLAKLMLTKLTAAKKFFNPSLCEELSDLLFEVGKDLSQKSRWVEGSFWLRAADDAIARENSEALSGDASELRISIARIMVKCLIHQEGEHNRRKAWDIVWALSKDHGDKLIVLLLKLELVAVEPAPSAEDYRHTLSKVIDIIHLTDANINTILHHIHKLKRWDSAMANSVLLHLLRDRLFGGEHQVWLEKTLITMIWNLATSSILPNAVILLAQAFDQVELVLDTPMSPSATHAAHILMWKQIEAASSQKNYALAEQWINLSLHGIFNSAGRMNVGKLQRKLIFCALERQDTAKAWLVATNMSETDKSDAATQYLLYKCAIQCRDAEKASQCFNNICSNLNTKTNKDASMIYACILEAQCEGNQDQIVDMLQRALKHFEYLTPSGVHLPALLRCTIRLLMRDSEQRQNKNVNSLCEVFENAVLQAERSREQDNGRVFNIHEIDWLSRNCYNLSLKICHAWQPNQTIRLAEAALKFIEIYPVNHDPAVVADLSLRRLFCNFVLCTLWICLARNENKIELQLKYYLSARQCVVNWRSNLPEQMSRLEGGARSDLNAKNATLISYDFEAAARLQSWNDFDVIIAQCQSCEDTKVYSILADTIMASKAPTEVFIRSLQQIVNATWQMEKRDVEKLSRWIRCITSQILLSDDDAVVRFLDQVITIVETINSKGQLKSYPEEELEWLATTIFNRSIDFYCSSQDAQCREWAGRALTLGSFCNDGGITWVLLQDKFRELVR